MSWLSELLFHKSFSYSKAEVLQNANIKNGGSENQEGLPH